MSVSTKTLGTVASGSLFAKTLNRELSAESLNIITLCFGNDYFEINADNIEVLYENGFTLADLEFLLKDDKLAGFRKQLENFIFGTMEELPRGLIREFLEGMAEELRNPYNWK